MGKKDQNNNQDKKQKKHGFFEYWYLWLLSAIAGIAVLLASFRLSTDTDIEVAAKTLSDTVNYIKKQCATYSSLNLASEMKSLMRMMETAQQVNRDIQYERHIFDKDVLDLVSLKRYTEENYLSGVILLDADGTVQLEYNTDDLGSEGLKDTLEKEAVLNVTEHCEKNYAARIDCEDGSYVDLATVGRSDCKGVIAVYYHTPKEYVESYSLSYQKLLAGYSMANDGTIVVTSGEQIIASNDESLIGKNVNEVAVLMNIRARGESGKLVHVKSDFTGPGWSFGLIDRGRDYYVYAYRAERDIFKSTPMRLIITVIVYALVILMIQVVRWRTRQHYKEEQMLREQQYREEELEKEQAYQEELKKAARKAESANISKTQFLQRMSHDIRTPINGIRGMVSIGDYYKDDMQKQAECRKKIWEASGLLLELVNEVLDMGKLESGEIVLESRPFDLLKLSDEICDVLDKQAAERGITISREKPNVKHSELIGSPLHLKRLLMNILSNAIKYNKDNGSIHLNCCEVESTDETAVIEFTCADTGIGMSKEYQKHLFEPFTQENSKARTTYEGTGLGMAITKSLVDKMGGTITFESEQGVGTTYHITIPFEIDKNQEVEENGSIEAAEASISGMHVLLVEDNELNMEIAEFMLQNEGVTVETATNGEEAVQKFDASKPGTYDAILMDVMMPVMDGHEATGKIRALSREDAATIPIIAMTANAFADDRKKAFEAGMNEHLTKPLEVGALIKVLARFKKR